jgi:glycosyltransferase involved in cell wall biosynthesis
MREPGMGSGPLVSVVTPVYNGARYLAECAESVLAQTHGDWEYVIVDNQSTDGTPEIAASFANRDPRIRVHRTDTFLPIMENWNGALRQVHPKARYVKVVHADDWLYPRCLESMVALAEANPEVGVVGAYRLHQDRPEPPGVGPEERVIPGREAARRYLVERIPVFGTPSSILMRADLVRDLEPLYNEASLSSDQEACLRMLQRSDFGFVPELLTFTREHPENVTSRMTRLGLAKIGWYHAVATYGTWAAGERDYPRLLASTRREYYTEVARLALRPGGRAVLQEHHRRMAALGHPFSLTWSGLGVLDFLADRILNPGRSLGSLARRWRSR